MYTATSALISAAAANSSGIDSPAASIPAAAPAQVVEVLGQRPDAGIVVETEDHAGGRGALGGRQQRRIVVEQPPVRRQRRRAFEHRPAGQVTVLVAGRRRHTG
ncbi:hypothetical protein NG726_34165, partial [Pseudomonas sp. MOB-449]|nr:hypothetical protein [Pseudomonas sp. MOB-449]